MPPPPTSLHGLFAERRELIISDDHAKVEDGAQLHLERSSVAFYAEVEARGQVTTIRDIFESRTEPKQNIVCS